MKVNMNGQQVGKDEFMQLLSAFEHNHQKSWMDRSKVSLTADDKKLYEKEKRYEEDYNNLMNTNLIKEFYTTKSPHLLISRKWFQRIKLSSIDLNPLTIAFATSRSSQAMLFKAP